MTKSKTFYAVDLDNLNDPKVQKVIISGTDLNDAFKTFKETTNLELFDSLDSAIHFIKKSIGREEIRLNQVYYNLRYIKEDNIDVQTVNTSQFKSKKR